MWMGRSLMGLVLVVTACGGNALDARSTEGHGGAAAVAGTSSGGSTTAGSSGAGAAGGAPVTPAIDISGRWGLLGFEDPVGVQIVERDGTIGGQGCDVHAPPLPPDGQPDLCGPLSGSLEGEHAQF